MGCIIRSQNDIDFSETACLFQEKPESLWKSKDKHSK